MTEGSCLHCEINELVREHIDVAGEDEINLADLIAKIGESLVDLILLGPEDQWSNLLAAAIRDIGHAFLEKGGAIDSGADTAH
jgi:peptide subunit release factor 1 (eRF1)